MASACVPDHLPDGREVAVVVVKATWEVGDDGTPRLPLIPQPVRRTGVRRRSDVASSCRYPSDLAPVKPGTDVLLVGTARPPPQPVIRMPLTLRIAREDHWLIEKTMMVSGRRIWESRLLGSAPSEPHALEPTELCWENTWGGQVAEGEPWLVERRNPVGMGLARNAKDRVGLVAPPIEDPRHPLTDKEPAPAGFGPIEPSWAPRSARFGTADERWRRERAPLCPEDFDPRYYSVAPDDQWVAEPLDGGENVEVIGVRPGRAWRFRLPTARPVLRARVRGQEVERRPALDTVIIDADEGRVELVWRTAFTLPRKAELLGRVTLAYDRPPPDELVADLASRRREISASSASPAERDR